MQESNLSHQPFFILRTISLVSKFNFEQIYKTKSALLVINFSINKVCTPPLYSRGMHTTS